MHASFSSLQHTTNKWSDRKFTTEIYARNEILSFSRVKTVSLSVQSPKYVKNGHYDSSARVRRVCNEWPLWFICNTSRNMPDPGNAIARVESRSVLHIIIVIGHVHPRGRKCIALNTPGDGRSNKEPGNGCSSTKTRRKINTIKAYRECVLHSSNVSNTWRLAIWWIAIHIHHYNLK